MTGGRGELLVVETITGVVPSPDMVDESSVPEPEPESDSVD
jgi:hypothetical protein